MKLIALLHIFLVCSKGWFQLVGEGVARARNILDSIDLVSKKKGFETMRAKYDLLCDHVHPNYFSNDLFSVPTGLDKEKRETFLRNERVILIKGETELYLRKFPKEFQILKIRYLGMIISALDMCIKLFLEAEESFRKVSIKELKAEIPNRKFFLSLSKEKRIKLLKEINDS